MEVYEMFLMVKLAMKAFFASVILTVSSFFGLHDKKPVDLPQPTPVVIIDNQILTPTEIVEVTATPTIKNQTTLKPTINKTKPTSSINSEILKTFFGIADQNLVNQILNNKDQLNKYEQEYYQKYKNLPIPKLALDLNKIYGMPSKNGLMLCTGSQLKSLYDEIKKTEDEIAYEKMDSECHYNRSKQETKECQDWRRDHDQDRKTPTGSLDDQIKSVGEKMKSRSELYDNLLQKYCSNK